MEASAYFEFKGRQSPDRFIIKLVQGDKIEHARKVLRGEETVRIHVQGVVVQQKAPYNPVWSYHLKPESISFFENNIEVCDAAMRYIEEHLDEVGGALLPKFRWCPWCSELTRELLESEALSPGANVP